MVTPYTDDEWSEIKDELPRPEDPFMVQYLKGREALIQQEQKQRSDAAFRAALSPIGLKACAIVDRIRAAEQATVWTPAKEDALAQSERLPYYPGMMFTHAKARMEETKLWNIIRRLPKGALLHAHLDATVDFDYLFEALLGLPGMHMATDQPGLNSASSRENAALHFRWRKTSDLSGPEIWGSEYTPNQFVPLVQAADSYPHGGRDGFTRWLKTRCTISTTDSEEQFRGVDHIWTKFANCFMVAGQILHYEPMTRIFMQKLLSQLHEDGVSWAEFRYVWPRQYYRDKSETPESDHTCFLQTIDEEVAKFKAANPSFWGIRLISTTVRSFDSRSITHAMEQCIIQKLAFPHLIAGFDLVGPEDRGRTLKDLLPELFWFRKQCALEGLEIPFFFHAGETLGDGNDTDKNIFDAILLGTRRIGHGFSLYKHPLLTQMVRDKRILIESCPISNEVLRLCSSIMSHPLPALLAQGIACSLCNDDPAMLGQEHAGMSHDFWQAVQGWDNLGLAGLGSLAENSVRWSVFEDQNNEEWMADIKEASLGKGEKSRRLKEWRVKWEEFCLWVVTEYGDEENEESGKSN
ncbi:Adenosine deaminase CECR1-A [Ceratocystis fimbriata CBS 114723]|uniref:adenosine deaminase n=1 Tax=Ceratocystis fimbriata CBS 114723 TaxID=1035309 RepID=A0A2C5WWD4_9PEZI|nr:Adenosine deaminase CECR1-A [Ceratocystis fimbriata CBS 114723]